MKKSRTPLGLEGIYIGRDQSASSPSQHSSQCHPAVSPPPSNRINGLTSHVSNPVTLYSPISTSSSGNMFASSESTDYKSNHTNDNADLNNLTGKSRSDDVRPTVSDRTPSSLSSDPHSRTHTRTHSPAQAPYPVLKSTHRVTASTAGGGSVCSNKLSVKDAVVGKTLRSKKMEIRLQNIDKFNRESEYTTSTHTSSVASSSMRESAAASSLSTRSYGARKKVYEPDTSTFGVGGRLPLRTQRMLDKQRKIESFPQGKTRQADEGSVSDVAPPTLPLRTLLDEDATKGGNEEKQNSLSCGTSHPVYYVVPGPEHSGVSATSPHTHLSWGSDSRMLHNTPNESTPIASDNSNPSFTHNLSCGLPMGINLHTVYLARQLVALEKQLNATPQIDSLGLDIHTLMVAKQLSALSSQALGGSVLNSLLGEIQAQKLEPRPVGSTEEIVAMQQQIQAIQNMLAEQKQKQQLYREEIPGHGSVQNNGDILSLSSSELSQIPSPTSCGCKVDSKRPQERREASVFCCGSHQVIPPEMELMASEQRPRVRKELPRVLYRLVPHRTKFRRANELFEAKIDMKVFQDKRREEELRAAEEREPRVFMGGSQYEAALNGGVAVLENEVGDQLLRRGSRFSIENPLLKGQDDFWLDPASERVKVKRTSIDDIDLE